MSPAGTVPAGTVPAGKPWLDSQTIRSLAASALLLVLGWLALSVSTGAWDWRSLILQMIAILVPVVRRLADPDVVAPLDALNQSNPRRVP